MRADRQSVGRTGFSLVELLIALMVLGIGMAMVAGAFPVGLAYHQRAVDETIAGLLARTAISRVTLLRTNDQWTKPRPPEGDPDWGGQERIDRGYRDFWGHLSVVECFENTSEVQWLFDKDQHSGGLLEQQALGADIDVWLPREERIYGTDDRYGYQVFYHRVRDPGTGETSGSMTFVAYAVVQKAPPNVTGGDPFDRLPTPGKATVSSVDTGRRTVQLSGAAARPGALLCTIEDGAWYEVRDVDGDGNVYLTRSVSGLGQKQVWVVNNAIEVYAAVVNKQRVRGS